MYTLVLEGISEDAVVDLGSAADEYYDLKKLRTKLTEKEKLITSRMSYIKQYILDNMPIENLTGVSGKKALVTSVIKEIPTVSDWSVFYTYVLQNNRMDLLQKRLQTRSCMETIVEGDNIPGVEIKEIVDLSVKKNR